jgi:protein-tyrosine-phosphatase/predicted ATP-grasp superfamily ATP-dependent carboligase
MPDERRNQPDVRIPRNSSCVLMIPSRRAKVLVLDGHSKAAAAAVLALPMACELHASAVEEDCVCFASHRITKRLIQPRTVSGLREWLETLDRTERYDLVIPSTEVSLLAVKAQTLEPSLRARAAIPPEAALDIALDKRRTLEQAEKLGIPIPHGRLIVSLDGLPPRNTWPTVIKPIHTKVAAHDDTLSLSVRICANPTEREEALADVLPWSPVIEQDYFRGRGFGVEVLFEHGEPRWLFAHERIHELPVTGGASSYRRAVGVPEVLRRATIDLLSSLDWHGVAMVEFKVADDGDYRLMEINPRLWGSLPLAIAAGVNFPLGLLRLATGESPGRQPRYNHHFYARDIVKDTHWFEDSFRERHNALLVAPLRFGDFVALLRPLTGRECWDLFRWREPGMWWHTVRPAFQGIGARLNRIAVGITARSHWRRLKSRWQDGDIRRVLVVCRENLFRSPIVAAMLRSSLVGLETSAAGIEPGAGRTAPAEWTDVVRQTLGLDLSQHRTQTVSEDDLDRAELVLVMDVRDWRALSAAHPEAMGKAVLLGIAGAENRSARIEIHSPLDGDQTALRAIVMQLRQCAERLILQRNQSIEARGHSDALDAFGFPRK